MAYRRKIKTKERKKMIEKEYIHKKKHTHNIPIEKRTKVFTAHDFNMYDLILRSSQKVIKEMKKN